MLETKSFDGKIATATVKYKFGPIPGLNKLGFFGLMNNQEWKPSWKLILIGLLLSCISFCFAMFLLNQFFLPGELKEIAVLSAIGFTILFLIVTGGGLLLTV